MTCCIEKLQHCKNCNKIDQSENPVNVQGTIINAFGNWTDSDLADPLTWKENALDRPKWQDISIPIPIFMPLGAQRLRQCIH